MILSAVTDITNQFVSTVMWKWYDAEEKCTQSLAIELAGNNHTVTFRPQCLQFFNINYTHCRQTLWKLSQQTRRTCVFQLIISDELMVLAAIGNGFMSLAVQTWRQHRCMACYQFQWIQDHVFIFIGSFILCCTHKDRWWTFCIIIIITDAKFVVTILVASSN